MKKELKNLITYLKKTNNKEHDKILKLAQEYTSPSKKLENQGIEIDLLELRSLVDSSVEIAPQDIKRISV